ncbi:hypothetical protein BC830DRAFT_1106803 [Chytriomyces sp. MP71]|nr:hypothetical protein BC830DRAFT_1106803 [Chytriomyces sp. MP71]
MLASTTFIAYSLIFALQVSAFTNGTLLPRYLCGPANDGMPKSLGGVLKFAKFNKDTPLAFNADPNNNLAMTAATMSDSPVNTAFMLASFHNTLNSIEAQTNVIAITSNAVLTPGQPFPLILSSRAADLPLDGAMIYAQDANGNRLGSFSDAGATFSPFPGCGQDAQGNNFGVVHHQIVADNGVYSQLTWNAPATLKAGDVITFKGLAVDDNGFGTHESTFTVGTQQPSSSAFASAAATSAAVADSATIPASSPVVATAAAIATTSVPAGSETPAVAVASPAGPDAATPTTSSATTFAASVIPIASSKVAATTTSAVASDSAPMSSSVGAGASDAISAFTRASTGATDIPVASSSIPSSSASSVIMRSSDASAASASVATASAAPAPISSSAANSAKGVVTKDEVSSSSATKIATASGIIASRR